MGEMVKSQNPDQETIIYVTSPEPNYSMLIFQVKCQSEQNCRSISNSNEYRLRVYKLFYLSIELLKYSLTQI